MNLSSWHLCNCRVKTLHHNRLYDRTVRGLGITCLESGCCSNCLNSLVKGWRHIGREGDGNAIQQVLSECPLLRVVGSYQQRLASAQSASKASVHNVSFSKQTSVSIGRSLRCDCSVLILSFCIADMAAALEAKLMHHGVILGDGMALHAFKPRLLV